MIIDDVIREFFHLLILEFLNPQYALFECVNGLYKPNSNSYINNNHLFYFKFFGKVLARCICDSKLAKLDCTCMYDVYRILVTVSLQAIFLLFVSLHPFISHC